MSEPARPLDRLQAEARLGQSAPVTVPLGGHDVTIRPLRQWRSSAVAAMRAGDFDGWARTSLDGDGYTQWQRIDPTIEEIEDMFAAWSAATGQSPGESSASPR